MRPKALVTRKLLPEAHAVLDRHLDVRIGAVGRDLTREELILNIRDQEGLLSLLVDTVDREVMESAPRLKIIANCAVGYNNIDIENAAERGIMVTNTPGVLTDSTADLTWALILAAARRLPQADRFTRQGRFSGWALDLFLGRDITGKCLGIVGMGRIGRAVALRAQAFRMETLYFDPHPLEREEERSFKATYSPFEELLARADIITLHTSLTEASTHLIGARELALMKRTGILINVSRGPVVDEKALARALKEGEIWGAGLDVFEREPEITPELFDLENVVLLPHIGSASIETRLAMASTAARNLVAGLTGKTPPNLIDLPKPDSYKLD